MENTKTPSDLIKEYFGSVDEMMKFLDKIFNSHLSSDEFAEQTLHERKTDLFNFEQLVEIINKTCRGRNQTRNNN